MSGALLVLTGVVFLLGVDALRSDFNTEPLVLIPLLIFSAGLLGVDVKFPGSGK